jgi:hypothetical protein
MIIFLISLTLMMLWRSLDVVGTPPHRNLDRFDLSAVHLSCCRTNHEIKR